MQPILEPKNVPKGEQNGAQNGPKSNAKINMKQEGFEDPLGSVLGLSWVVWGVDLGVKNHQISLVFKGFREKIMFLKKIRFQTTFWPILGRFCRQKGSNMGPKWDAKRSQNDTKNRSKKCLDFLSLFGALRRPWSTLNRPVADRSGTPPPP